jgi:hypothetical protein
MGRQAACSPLIKIGFAGGKTNSGGQAVAAMGILFDLGYRYIVGMRNCAQGCWSCVLMRAGLDNILVSMLFVVFEASVESHPICQEPRFAHLHRNRRVYSMAPHGETGCQIVTRPRLEKSGAFHTGGLRRRNVRYLNDFSGSGGMAFRAVPPE